MLLKIKKQKSKNNLTKIKCLASKVNIYKIRTTYEVLKKQRSYGFTHDIKKAARTLSLVLQFMVCVCVRIRVPCTYATVYGVYVCVHACAMCVCRSIWRVCVCACTRHARMPQYMEGMCEGVCVCACACAHVHASCAYAQILEWKKGELVSNASHTSFLQSATPKPILLSLSCGGG